MIDSANILIVETDLAFAHQVADLLHRHTAGEWHTAVVEDAAAADACLNEEAYDCLLWGDGVSRPHNRPWWGPDAIQPIPVILLSDAEPPGPYVDYLPRTGLTGAWPMRLVRAAIRHGRLQAETAVLRGRMKRQERLYPAIVQDQTDLICRISADELRYTYMNDVFRDFFSGWDRPPEIGLFLKETADTRNLNYILDFLAANQDKDTLRFELTHKIGPEPRRIEWFCRVLRSEITGRPVEYQAVGRDITDLWQTLSALKQSRAFWNALVENSSLSIAVADTNGRFLFQNPVAQQLQTRILGDYGRVGEPVSDWLISGDRTRFESFFARVLAGEHFMFEQSTETVDGQKIWLRFRYDRVVTPDGQVLGVAGIVEDITAYRDSIQALTKSEARLATILQSAGVGITTLTSDGRIDLYNAVSRQYGQALLDATLERGRPILDALGGSPLGSIQADIEAAMAGESIVREVKLESDEKTYWFKLRLDPLRLPDGTMDGLLMVHDDITDLRLSQEKLHQLAALIEQSRDYIGLLEPSGRYVYVNPAVVAGFGAAAEDPQEKMVKTIFPTHSALFDRARESVTETGLWQGEIDLFVPALNEARRLQNSLFAVQYALDGAVTLMGFIARDVTEEKKTELALKRSNARYQLITANASDIIIQMTMDGRLQFVSAAVVDVLGYQTDAWTQLADIVDCLHPDDLALFHDALQKVMADADQKIYLFHRIRHQDGRYVSLETCLQSYRDEHGRAEGVIAIVRDLTERLQAEEEMRRRDQLLREVGRLAGIGGWELDLQTREFALTDEIYHIYGKPLDYRPQSMTEMLSFYAPEAHPVISEAFKALIADGRAFDLELPFISADGREHWVRVIGKADRQGGSAVNRIYGTFQDITTRKRVETELTRALNREKELRRLKSNFITTASHEFRTPLATILATADFLENYGDRVSADNREKRFQKIRNQIKHMIAMLEDVLLVERSEGQPNAVFQPQLMAVDNLCREIVEDFREQHQRTIFLTMAEDIPPTHADATLVRQIVTNLLSNAIKYSDDDTPVEVDLSPAAEGGLHLRVSDYGRGIPTADLRHLFEPFYRAGNTENNTGTGLGLAIVKRAAELHGGEVTCHSQLNVGTTMFVHLPDAAVVKEE